jgi:hypothetical protein
MNRSNRGFSIFELAFFITICGLALTFILGHEFIAVLGVVVALVIIGFLIQWDFKMNKKYAAELAEEERVKKLASAPPICEYCVSRLLSRNVAECPHCSAPVLTGRRGAAEREHRRQLTTV